MIIPSIDIAAGEAVQLIGGKEQALSAGDPLPLANKFGFVGEVAVIDLDAALSRGENSQQIYQLLENARCRVGGGIRDLESATRWLDAGASKIILGTSAKPELLKSLPKNRVIAALDAIHIGSEGNVVDRGWTRETGRTVLAGIEQLRDYVGGFLITFVEREGRLTGIDLPTIQKYVDAAGEARVTIAGGITSADEIAALDKIGADAQVGMALYTQRISLAEGFAAVLNSDRQDHLWPTIVTNELGQALGLAYSNPGSLAKTLESGDVHYFSRSRGLWRKGAASGATQYLLGASVDCDRDTLRFSVRQNGRGFCHLDRDTCFGNLTGISNLQRQLFDRCRSAPKGSYTKRLMESSQLLASKITEEALELSEARTRQEIIHEAADVLYFTMTKLAREEITLAEIEKELDRRALKITRRSLSNVDADSSIAK